MKIKLFAIMFGLAFSLSAEPVHPHLMFDQADIPVLREKVKSGIPKQAYDRMLERCGKHLTMAALEKFTPGGNETGPKDLLFELAFAYLLSGDAKYKDKFVELLDTARKTQGDLYLLQYDAAMLFDLGYDIMGEENRKYVKQAILRRAHAHKSPNTAAFYPYSNWGLICGLDGARDELVLYGHPEYNPQALANMKELTREIFRNFIDDDGAANEGGNYLAYGWWMSGGSHAQMINRKTKELVAKTNLPKLPAYLWATETPGGCFPHFGDCGKDMSLDNFTLYGLMCLLPEDPILHRMAGRVEDNRWYNRDPVSGIILYQPPRKMPLPQLPKANYYPQCGIMCYKSAYDDPKAFYAITQARLFRSHAHEDVGTFLLSAYGKNFVTESGYGEGELFKHNMVSINNQSPKANGGGGTVRQCLLSPHALAMNTNLSNLWNRSKPPGNGDPLGLTDWSVVMAERSFVVLPENKALGIPPYVLVSDYVKKDERNQDYSWLLQTFPQYEVKINKNIAKIIADKDDLAVAVLTPNNAKLTVSKWLTEYRFKGKEFQRLEATVKDKYGRFLVALYPRTGAMPELNVDIAEDPFQRKLTWTKAVDYIDWNGEFNSRPYELALFRMPKEASFARELPKNCQYLVVNTNGEFKIGALPIITSQVFGGGQDRDREIKMSVAFDGDSLDLDIYTNELMTFQIPFLTEVKAFAPEVKQVICNGGNLQLERDGDYVTVRAYSRVIKSAAGLRTPNYEKIIRNIEQALDKKPSMIKQEQ